MLWHTKFHNKKDWNYFNDQFFLITTKQLIYSDLCTLSQNVLSVTYFLSRWNDAKISFTTPSTQRTKWIHYCAHWVWGGSGTSQGLKWFSRSRLEWSVDENQSWKYKHGSEQHRRTFLLGIGRTTQRYFRKTSPQGMSDNIIK